MRFAKRNGTLLGLLLAVSLVMASAVASLLTARDLVAANQLVDHSHQVREHLAQVLADLAEAESGARGFIITGDPIYVMPYSASLGQVNTHLQTLRSLTSDNSSQQERLDQLDALVARRVELLEEGINLRQTQGFDAAQRLVLSNTGKALMDEVRQVVGAMEAEEEALLSSRAEAARRSARTANVFIFAGNLVSIVLVGAIFVALRNEIRERRRSEAALAHESQLLHVLMDTLPDTIYFKDTASRFTRVNRSQAKVLGLADPRQALGKTDLDFQAGELAQGFFEEEQDIIQSGRAIIDRIEYNPTPDGQPRWFSATKLPMLGADGNITGIVGISKDVTQRVSTEEALQQANARLTRSFAAVERHNRAMTVLNEMLDLLQTCETTEEAYGLIVHWAQLLIPVELGVLYMLNASRNLVEAVARWGSLPLPPNEELLQPTDCWALRRGRLHWVKEAASETVCRHVSGGPAGSYVCVPLSAQGETLGLLHLRHALRAPEDGEAAATVERDYPMALALAEHLSLALANLKLREKLQVQAIRDPLTGLYNRRYMEESLERELLRAERRRSSFAIIMIDLDHFKRFNDTFGHGAGDALLRTFGEYLRKSVRGEDIACRYEIGRAHV